MNEQDRLSRCLGQIDGALVDEAAQYQRRRHTFPVWGRVAAAACVCLAVGAAWFFRPAAEVPGPGPADDPSVGQPAIDVPAIDPGPGDQPAVYIPAIALPEPVEGVAADMIGLVVWKGHVYTAETQYYQGAEAETLLPLVGDYVGTAIGNINEWSTQDEYAKELASTYAGEIYTVRGYDEDFRLCATGVYEEDGQQVPWLQFFERLNGIGLSVGAELFSHRLGIEHWQEVAWLTHEDWDNGRDDYRPLDLSAEQIDGFLAALNDAPFEYVHDAQPGFYTAEEQGHLFFRLEDGTTVQLRLMAGGYVGYQDLGWYYVRMPGEVFDAVFAACQE